jgi:hypothetical protein
MPRNWGIAVFRKFTEHCYLILNSSDPENIL